MKGEHAGEQLTSPKDKLAPGAHGARPVPRDPHRTTHCQGKPACPLAPITTTQRADPTAPAGCPLLSPSIKAWSELHFQPQDDRQREGPLSKGENCPPPYGLQRYLNTNVQHQHFPGNCLSNLWSAEPPLPVAGVGQKLNLHRGPQETTTQITQAVVSGCSQPGPIRTMALGLPKKHSLEGVSLQSYNCKLVTKINIYIE